MPYKDLAVRREKGRNYSKAWRSKSLENLEKTRAYAREYQHRRTPAQNAESCRRYQQSHKEKIKVAQRRKHLRLKFGLTLEDFDRMLASQGYVCAICFTDNWGAHGPMVDHDHVTGKIRGILCHKCNLGIGHLDDSISKLENAIVYLKKYR